MFTDNDDSGLIAGMMNAEVLLYSATWTASSKGHPDDPEAELIEEILPKQELRQYISADRSSTGREVCAKYNIASKLAKRYPGNSQRKKITSFPTYSAPNPQ